MDALQHSYGKRHYLDDSIPVLGISWMLTREHGTKNFLSDVLHHHQPV